MTTSNKEPLIMEVARGMPDPAPVLRWLKQRLKARRMEKQIQPPQPVAADVIPLRRYG